jgi:glycosyltransferase involved in cell wall biosynthesis
VIYKNPVGKLVFLISRYASRIVVVSKRELSLVNESTAPRKLENTLLIYNGITDQGVGPKRDYNKTTTVFALTSRLVKTKGISEIIEASKMLDKNGYNHRILLLGEGPEETIFRKQAGKSIIFMGFPDDALSYVAGADVFVHPSYNEAFSLSLVEAAMLGKPTIATNVGGNPEIIKDKKTGILIRPMDVDSLYSALEYAIKNPEILAEYAKALRKSYEKEFQFDRIVREQLIPLYNN